MPIANVTLNNTFDDWRTATNQLISFVNDVDSGNLTKFYSNSAVLTVTENVARGGKNYITLNVSSDVLDTSTLNIATANAVNVVFTSVANIDARIIVVSNHANTINAVANAGIIQANTARLHANAAFASANAGQAAANAGLSQANTARDHANSGFAIANSGLAIASAGLLQANTARDHANTAHASANAALASSNAGLLQANTARVHANAAFDQANTARTHANAGFSKANTAETIAIAAFTYANTISSDADEKANAAIVTANAAFDQANTARVHANTAHASANAGLAQANTARIHANVSFEQANTARIHANNAYTQANLAYEFAASVSGNNANVVVSNKGAFDTANAAFDQANTARTHANAAFFAANNAVTDYSPAFEKANIGFSNTAGSSFVGNMQIPTGNLTLGDGTTQGIRLHVNAWIGVANVFPQVEIMGGSQFIQINANTNIGGWNDLILDRDISLIYSKGTFDDSANLIIGPWTDSSFGYKQDGAGRHGFNTSNPRHALDANGTANISSTLTVGANIIVRGTSITINGLEAIQNTANQTVTNKRITPRVATTSTNSATPTLNTDNTDHFIITGQTVNITSMTTNLSGSPTNGQKLIISLTAGSGTPTITWGTSFESSTVSLPGSMTTTRQDIGFLWNSTTSKWRCVAVV